MKTIACTYCGTQSIYGDRVCGGCNARIYYGTGVLDLFKWSLVAGCLCALLVYEILWHFSISGYNKYAAFVIGIPALMAALVIARMRRGRVTFQHFPRF
ncbi:MAG: hypothetical protein AB7E46_04400 [Desulfovibrio sp.]|jgi:hypothetical protein